MVTAHNGIEAVEIVRQQEIHLVLLDIMMPEMDGIESMVETVNLKCTRNTFTAKVRIPIRCSDLRWVPMIM